MKDKKLQFVIQRSSFILHRFFSSLHFRAPLCKPQESRAQSSPMRTERRAAGLLMKDAVARFHQSTTQGCCGLEHERLWDEQDARLQFRPFRLESEYGS